MTKNKLVWNVYIENINNREIETYNIFTHGGFYESLSEIKNNYKKFEKDLTKKLTSEKADYEKFLNEYARVLNIYKDSEFKRSVEKEIAYYFKSRCEWEITLTSFPVMVEKEELKKINVEEVTYRETLNLSVEKKVDVYSQVCLNFDAFINYLWDNIDFVKKVKK